MTPIKKLVARLAVTTLVSTFALGLTSCDKKIIQTLPKDSGKEYHVKTKECPESSLTFKNVAYTPASKTGQDLNIELSVHDGQGFWNVKTMMIYEDGKLIREKKGGVDKDFESLEAAVNHEEPGVHSYFGEIVYENWETRRTKIKEIEFTGKFTDLKPLTRIRVQDNKLMATANDYGDDKGIKILEVYEDGKFLDGIKPNLLDLSLAQFISKSPYTILITIPLDKEKKGKYKYFSKCVDKNGNTAMSETITINYD